MRPKSIRMFDRLFLGSLILGVVNYFVFFDEAAELTRSELEASGVAMSSGIMIASFVFGMGISLVLWFLISRKASNVAKWILVVLTAWGLIGLPTTLGMFETPMILATLLVTAIQLAAIYFLFRPDARSWFDAGGPIDPSTFE